MTTEQFLNLVADNVESMSIDPQVSLQDLEATANLFAGYAQHLRLLVQDINDSYDSFAPEP